jgi:hypothetical protein
VALLSSSNADMQEKAAGALRSIAAGKGLKADIVATPGCLQGLVVMLTSSKTGVAEVAAGVLRSLARGRALKQQIANTPGCLRGLQELVKRLPRSCNPSGSAAAKALSRLGAHVPAQHPSPTSSRRRKRAHHGDGHSKRRKHS